MSGAGSRDTPVPLRARLAYAAPAFALASMGQSETALVLTASAAAVAVLMASLWLASLWLRDASIVDPFWGPGFALVAWVALCLADGHPARQWLLVGMATAWGLRLGGYLAWRNVGKGEDFRYRKMREHWGDAFPWVSLFTVFTLQGVLMWLISLPLQLGQVADEPAWLGGLAVAGALLWLVGLLFETVGDWQMARFKADPANEGLVMDRGLWAWTRHPNYFGDALVWWGIGLVAAGAPAARWTLFSPALMTFLLLKVSGVALLEKDIAERRPGYREYAERTSAFFPWPTDRPEDPANDAGADRTGRHHDETPPHRRGGR